MIGFDFNLFKCNLSVYINLLFTLNYYYIKYTKTRISFELNDVQSFQI